MAKSKFSLACNRENSLLSAVANLWKTVPPSAGTFRTDGATFAFLLVGVVILTAGLMIFPALTLGPIVEALSP
jgi:K+-transporting ATPase A subunit